MSKALDSLTDLHYGHMTDMLWKHRLLHIWRLPIMADKEQNFANALAFGLGIPAICRPLTTSLWTIPRLLNIKTSSLHTHACTHTQLNNCPDFLQLEWNQSDYCGPLRFRFVQHPVESITNPPIPPSPTQRQVRGRESLL